MNTWHELITEFGGPKSFGAAIGVSHTAARQMASRNNVHSDYWPVIVARAQRAGLEGITFEFLASLKRGRFRSATPEKTNHVV